MTFREARHLLAADLRERAVRGQKRYGALSYVKLFFDPPALAVAIFRIQAWLAAAGWKRLATLLRHLNVVCFSIDIGSEARIGPGFIIYHPNCVAICGQCRAGRNFHLVHHNTVSLGLRSLGAAAGEVVIGNDVILGCGSRIDAPVTIGDNSFIGANAVVVADVPAFTFYLEEDLTYAA